VDPEHFRVSMEEGEVYSEKTKIEFVCEEDEVEELLAVIRNEAATGRRGDGLIAVTDVNRIVNIRPGDEDRLALL
jgi:nitrogen regulatory protein PII